MLLSAGPCNAAPPRRKVQPTRAGSQTRVPDRDSRARGADRRSQRLHVGEKQASQLSKSTISNEPRSEVFTSLLRLRTVTCVPQVLAECECCSEPEGRLSKPEFLTPFVCTPNHVDRLRRHAGDRSPGELHVTLGCQSNGCLQVALAEFQEPSIQYRNAPFIVTLDCGNHARPLRRVARFALDRTNLRSTVAPPGHCVRSPTSHNCRTPRQCSGARFQALTPGKVGSRHSTAVAKVVSPGCYIVHSA